MRPSGLVTGLVASVIVGGLAVGGLSAGHQVLAPAYDAVTVSSMRSLGIALHSYALAEGDLDGLQVADLASWGWEPGETTAVWIRVDGDRFHAVGQDTRPGASAFEVGTLAGEGALTVRAVEGVARPTAPIPGVVVTSG